MKHHAITLTLFAFLAMGAIVSNAAFANPSDLDPDSDAVHGKAPKNVILMIGDGMGPQQIGLLLTYARLAPNSIYQDRDRECAMERFIDLGVTGLSLTSPADKIVVDSACSATQLATGYISGSEMIGLDHHGHRVETVLELGQKLGKATGLVSDTRITHATPAAFASHQPHRSLENEIAEDLVMSGVDVLLSGGLRHWLPKGVNEGKKSSAYQEAYSMVGDAVNLRSKRKDQKDLLKMARDQGYALAFDREQLNATRESKLLGLFANSGMMDGIQHTRWKDRDDRKEPALHEMTSKALEILSQNENGFFLMVEGGQIDWAGHANDTADMLHNMIKFDEAIDVVLKWVEGRGDTVVILTADHETGSFGFSYSRHNLPEPKTLPGEAFKDRPFLPNYNFVERSVLDRIYQQKSSYFSVLHKFNDLDETKRTPAQLAAMLTECTGFPITDEEAATVLASEPNEHYCEGHSYLGAKCFPKVDDFEEFYVYGEEIRSPLVARIMAKHQNTVWGTGTHTATPVTVTAIGPREWTKEVAGIKTHPEVGEYLKRLICVKNEEN